MFVVRKISKTLVKRIMYHTISLASKWIETEVNHRINDAQYRAARLCGCQCLWMTLFALVHEVSFDVFRCRSLTLN